MRVGLIDSLRKDVKRLLDGVDVPARCRLRHIEERVIDLIRRRGLTNWQNLIDLHRCRSLWLDLDDPLAQDGVRADRESALRADDVATRRERHQDVVALDS